MLDASMQRMKVETYTTYETFHTREGSSLGCNMACPVRWSLALVLVQVHPLLFLSCSQMLRILD